MENNDNINYMPLMGGTAWTSHINGLPHRTKLTVFLDATDEEGTHCPAESITLYHDNAKRVYDLLRKTFGPQLTKKIEVDVRGGIAYCDDDRVKIIDHDNKNEGCDNCGTFDREEGSKFCHACNQAKEVRVTWSNSLDILKEIQAAKAEAEDGSPDECVNLLEIIEHKLINGEVKP